MKQFIHQYRYSIIGQALHGGFILSIVLYGLIRGVSYEFDMNTREEVFFFLKIMGTSMSIITVSTAAPVLLFLFLKKK